MRGILPIMIKVNFLVASVALCAGVSASANPTLPMGIGAIPARILAAHNAQRAAVGAPPLQWDATLAAHAASYGPALLASRQLVHSPRESRPGERENLAMGWHRTMSPERLVAMWTRERQLLVPGSYLFPGTSRTGRWEDISHYTQMVWPTTTTVGCAIFSTDWDYLICRYSPPGNKVGKPIFASGSLAFRR